TATVAGNGRKRGKGRALGVIAGVVVIAGLVTGGGLWFAPQVPAPGPGVVTTPTVAPEPPLDPLLTATDLGSLAGSSWVVSGAGAEDPVCLAADAAGMPTPDRTARRVLTAQNEPTDTRTHVVDTYPDAATAARAYADRLTQSGTCTGTVALIVASYQLDGLADSAAVTTIDVQDDPVMHHTVLISQTGRNVSLIDLATAAKPPALDEVAAVATKPLARLCSGGEGTCPAAAVEVQDTVPAADQNPGWLLEADLPRINPGYGSWKATQPTSDLTIIGSQCETVDLTKVKDATALQRTLPFAADPAMPMGLSFGIDEVTYTFADASAAKKFQSRLNDDLSGCAKQIPTATVTDGPSTKGIGEDSLAFSGKSYNVVQKTASAAFPYRVAVLRADNRVTYLMANPTEKFNFTDAQWKAIMTRAGQRVTQLP
ncbi:MAG: hypothetical protein VB036_06565, partial [Propionicimonas sp.]|nr:hypothetical protein [Propionicimonas sp.]